MKRFFPFRIAVASIAWMLLVAPTLAADEATSSKSATAPSAQTKAPSAGPGSSATTVEVEVQKAVKYGTGGGEDLLLDLAKPKDAGGPPKKPRPCIVFIHGGGWAAGNRSAHLPHIQDVARAGYVAATISYRFAPKHVFPAQVEDSKCAVRWLRAHAAELNLDPNRIGAIGFSAGAHLSMMLGAMDKDDGLEGNGGWADQSSKVQCVVAYFGPTDLSAEFPDTSRNILKNFIGGTREEKGDAYQKASPITFVNKGDAPMLLLQGTKDVLVPHAQATVMADALTKAGVPGRVELLLGANHGWGGKELQRTIAAHMTFFEEHLRR